MNRVLGIDNRYFTPGAANPSTPKRAFSASTHLFKPAGRCIEHHFLANDEPCEINWIDVPIFEILFASITLL
jgi:hypothetical protein